MTYVKPSQSKPCRCGAPKLPGQGQRYCADCRELESWKLERKRKVGRLILMRTPCQACGGLKEPGRGRKVCVRCAQAPKRRRCQRCTNTVEHCKRLCPSCKAIALAKRRRSERIRHKRYRLLNPQKVKAAQRRRKHDRELERIDTRLRAERNGRTVTRNNVILRHDPSAVRVPAEPLLPYLLPRIEETGVTALGAVARIRPADLTRIADGRTPIVRIWQADRICVALGLQLANVYGDVA